MVKTQILHCIVLKSINLKDTDKMYVLYSKELGKISATAKGIRKITSKRSGALDTLNNSKVKVTFNSKSPSKGYMYISEVTTVNTFINLKSNLSKTKDAYYIIELFNKLVEELETNVDLYNLLLDTLKLLNDLNTNNQKVLTYFEINLLKILGYELTLDSCVVTKKPISTFANNCKFNMGLGGFVSPESNLDGISLNQKEVNYLYNISKRNLRLINFTTPEFSNIHNLINTFINNILDQSIKSYGFLG